MASTPALALFKLMPKLLAKEARPPVPLLPPGIYGTFVIVGDAERQEGCHDEGGGQHLIEQPLMFLDVLPELGQRWLFVFFFHIFKVW